MFSYITELDTVDTTARSTVSVSARDLDSLLYAFMDEFLFQAHAPRRPPPCARQQPSRCMARVADRDACPRGRTKQSRDRPPAQFAVDGFVARRVGIASIDIAAPAHPPVQTGHDTPPPRKTQRKSLG